MNLKTRRIPVKDRNRAVAFYSALLGIDLAEDTSAVCFDEIDGTSEAPLCVDVAQPLDDVLAMVWSNGGRILEPQIGSQPVALVMDCEGNRLELHGPSST